MLILLFTMYYQVFYVHNTSGEGSILYIGDIWLRMKLAII